MNKVILPLGVLLIIVGGIASALSPPQSTLPTWVMIAGVVLVAAYVIANWRSVAKRSTFFGFNALLMSLAMVAILTVVYLIAQNRDKSWDLTATGKYTLDPQTAKILDGLDHQVKILLFASPDVQQSRDFVQVKDLIDEYVRYSKNVTYQIIDPSKDYETAIQYAADLNPLGEATIIAEIEVQEKKEDGSTETRTFREKAKGLTQEDISNAIMKVTHREPVTAYFLVGHYERELDETQTGLALLKKFLEDENIKANSLRLGAVAEIPDDADIIAVVGPQEDLSETELAALEHFVLSGGGLFMALDPGDLPATTLKLREFGFEVGNDMVIGMAVGAESLDQLLRGIMTARPTKRIEIAEFDENHEITKDLVTSSVRLTEARSVDKIPVPPDGVTLTALAKTEGGYVGNTRIPNSWADVTPDQFRPGSQVPVEDLFDANRDTKGPVTVMMAAEIDLDRHPEGSPDPDNPKRKGKIVVVGDSDFITNGGMQVRGGVSRGHLDLALNTFNWLAGQVDLITIRQREVDNTSITLTKEQEDILEKLFVWVIPVIIALIGATVVIYRRWMYV